MTKNELMEMARKVGVINMVKLNSATVYKEIPGECLSEFANAILERAAVECEQSEAYRGSVFAQRIRALKPVLGKSNT